MKNLQLSDYLSGREALGLKTVTRRLGEKCRYKVGDVVYFGEALVATRPKDLAVSLTIYRRDGAETLQWQRAPTANGGPLALLPPVPTAWRWQRSVLPARFCPAACARRFGRIIAVSCERLGEIDEGDARLEGFDARPAEGVSAIEAFRRYWFDLNQEGPHPWMLVWRVQWVSITAEQAWKESR